MSKVMLHKYTLLTLLLLFSATLIQSTMFSQQASAVTASDWRPGRIIDDAVFYNKDSMSAAQIQDFLNAKVPTCDRWRASSNPSYQPPWTCLKEYLENPTTRENNVGRFNANGTPYQVPGGKSAAQIIWDVGQEYGINPQVLIVMLQKEQGLITDNWPWAVQYQKAMGYACPDTAPCDTQYYGFYNQVSSAAWQMKRYIAYPNSYNFKAGVTRNILWSPNSSCGASAVYIENAATAALYNYTPYQPNTAALNNMYGSGDGCSAYGNRNFWRYFNDWFGRTIVIGDVWYSWGDVSIDSKGDRVTIPIRLTTRPSSNIQIEFSVSDNSVANITQNQSLFFNQNNWETYQYITIAGKNSLKDTLGLRLFVSRVYGNDALYNENIRSYLSSLPLVWFNQSNDAIYRLFNPSTSTHVYTSKQSALSSFLANGYTNEGVVGYQCKSSDYTPLLINDKNIEYYNSKADFNDAILYNNTLGNTLTHLMLSGNRDYLLTNSSDEAAIARAMGYQSSTYFMLCGANQQMVYRLYSLAKGAHFYTTSEFERNAAVSNGYVYEGIGFSIPANGAVPVYRLYSQAKGAHFYTTSEFERNAAVSNGYVYEGVGYYL